MSQLTPCPECQRHVRKTEARCPFCDSALSLAHVAAPVLPRNRLGRAATFAFGASVVGATALVACSADEADNRAIYGAPPAGAGGGGGTGGVFAGGPLYGSPPSGGPNGGTDNDLGGATAIYGGPPAGAGGVDAGGAPAAGGAGGAGGTDDNGEGGGAFAVYGAPAGGDGNL